MAHREVRTNGHVSCWGQANKQDEYLVSLFLVWSKH